MKILAAIVSGLLLALSFPSFVSPSFHHYGGYLVWFALVPLLLADREYTGPRNFFLGYLQGVVFYSLLLYWVTGITEMALPARYGAYLALVLYLALYHGLFNLLRHRFAESGLGLVILPALWIALEYLRGIIFSGFTWGMLGYSLYHFRGLLELATLGGVYAVSFLVVSGNVLLGAVFDLRGKGAWRRPLGLAALLVAMLALPRWIPDPAIDTGRPIDVGMLQGNVDQGVKWSPQFKNENFVLYCELQKACRGCDLVVWPEAAATCYFSREPYFGDRVRQCISDSGCWTVVGAPRLKEGKGRWLNYNAALLFRPGRGIVDEYYKMHLVPFGEYVPLAGLLPFGAVAADLGAGDFDAGREAKVFKIPAGSFSASICYEVSFPGLIRRFGKSGAEFMVNLTNDGWYGRSAMPYQHVLFCVMRAVENGVYLVRSANSGISCIISPNGKILKPTPLFEQAVVKGTVYPRAGITFYTRFGDVFVWLMLLLSASFVFLSYRHSAGG